MGATVIPVIASIITSVLVSKAAASLASKLGLSDSASGLVGMLAGGYAGAAAYAAASPVAGAATTTTPGLLEQGVEGTAKTALAGAGGMPSGAPPGGIGRAGASPAPDQGMLTQGQGIVKPPPRPVQEPSSWMERLMSPDRTADLLAGAMKGYGEAGMEQYKIDRPEEIAQANAAGWAAGDPGGGTIGTINPTYPSQGT